MSRQIISVMMAAPAGSIVATLLWTTWLGGTGAPDPGRFIFGFALFTLFFTVPGAMVLMRFAFAFVERGTSLLHSALFLMVLGPLIGAALPVMVGVYAMSLGALYGFMTAASLATALWLLKAFPPTAT